MSLRFLLCFFAASVAGTAGLGQRMSLAEGVKAAVMRSDEIRVYALLSSDLNSLDDLLTSDCIYVHSSGRAQTKPELLAALKSGALKYQRLQYQAQPLIRLFGRETAVVTGAMLLEVTVATGETVKRTLATTAVYVLQAERWQLASYHSTTVEPPAAIVPVAEKDR